MCLFITYDSMFDNMLSIFGVKNSEFQIIMLGQPKTTADRIQLAMHHLPIP
jgi:hypothetical protein